MWVSTCESGCGRDGDKLRCRRCGSDGFASIKEPERGSGFGVGVSMSSVSSPKSMAFVDFELVRSASRPISSLSSISNGTESDMSDTDVAGDPRSQGCESSSS